MSALIKPFRNTLYVLAARGVDMASGLAMVALAARYLGVEAFGEYMVVFTIAMALAPWIAMGCARILVRDLAVNEDRSGRMIVSALWLSALLALLAVPVILAALWAVRMRSPLALLAGLAALAAQTALVLRQTVTSVLLAREVMVWEPLLSILSRVVSLSAFVVILVLKGSYAWLFLALASGEALAMVWAWRVMTRRFATPAPGFRRNEVLYLLRESAPVAAYNFLGDAPLYLSVLALQWFRNPVEVSYLQAPQRVLWPFMLAPIALMLAFMPALSRMAADVARFHELRGVYHVALRAALLFFLPVCAVATLYSEVLVERLFGVAFLPSASSFGILVWALLPFALKTFLNGALTAMGRQRLLLINHMAVAACMLLMAPVLARGWGYVGVSWAFLAAFVLLFALNHIRLARYLDGMSFWRPIARPVLAASLAALAAWGARSLWGAGIRPALIGLAVYGIGAWLLKALTRRAVLDVLRALAHKPARATV